MKLEPGAKVTPNVKLVRELGEGGMGAVWVAEHLALGTEVAVKFLQGDYANDPTARSRFSQEAAAASQVKSSHVVKIYDYGITDTNVPFIVMELLEGTDLAGRMTAGALPPSLIVPIVAQLCKALQAAHARNVVHRDVKPENVFLSQEGGETFVKLLDFGVAKTAALRALSSSGRRSTMAGESLGTPYYMSPEQFRSSKSIDHRSDLWSVGVLVYEALTGTLPFEAETVSALAIVVNDGKATPPSQVNPALPPAFDAWFAKACAREPGDRFESAKALADALSLSFGTVVSSPQAIDSGAYRQVVISHVPAEEVGDAALRDTSFASTGGARRASRSRTRVYAIAGLAGACVIGAIAFVATRSTTTTTTTSTTASATHDVPPPPSLASAPPPTPSHDEPVATTPGIATSATSATSAALQTTAKPVHTSQAQPSASASAKGKHERDIW